MTQEANSRSVQIASINYALIISRTACSLNHDGLPGVAAINSHLLKITLPYFFSVVKCSYWPGGSVMYMSLAFWMLCAIVFMWLSRYFVAKIFRFVLHICNVFLHLQLDKAWKGMYVYDKVKIYVYTRYNLGYCLVLHYSSFCLNDIIMKIK